MAGRIISGCSIWMRPGIPNPARSSSYGVTRIARAQRLAIAVRSDFAIDAQRTAQGATWLDRRLIAHEATPLSEGGFGRKVREAMNARIGHVEVGLARRQGQRVLFARDLLNTLRGREA